MNNFDTQREWRELEGTYSAMSDEELCELAEKAYELTELAKAALTAQLSARKLKVALVEQPPVSDEEEELRERDFNPEELDLVSVAQVWDAEDASRIMAVLYEAGVPAYLGPDNFEKVSEFHGAFDAGVEIKVRRADDYRAKYALRRDARPQSEDEPEDEPCAIQCPVCHSDEVVFEELVAAASASGSGTAQKFRWRCDACGHEWEDDGVEP